jgi:putative endonuclease
MKRQDTGRLGEHLAVEYLQKHGFTIIETNYHCRAGEIDIVARQGDCLVFIEVRAKTGTGFCTPEESVSSAKKRKIIAAANRYRFDHQDLPADWRIDFIAIEFDNKGKTKRLELIKNAISEL